MSPWGNANSGPRLRGVEMLKTQERLETLRRRKLPLRTAPRSVPYGRWAKYLASTTEVQVAPNEGDVPTKIPVPTYTKAETPREQRDALKEAVTSAPVLAEPREKKKEERKKRKEGANIKGDELTSMGAEAPEGVEEGDLERELADAFKSIRGGEAPPVEGWLPEKVSARISAVISYDEKTGTRSLLNSATGETIVSENDPAGAYIPWESTGTNRVGNTILVEKDSTGVWGVVQDFGESGTYKAEVADFAHAELGISNRFPNEVEAEVAKDIEIGADALVAREANRLKRIKPEGNWRKQYKIGQNRIDVTDLETITIDPETAMDFDDALSVRTLDNGDVEVWVHSASPIDFVHPNSSSFKEAMFRGTSVYLKGGVIPMIHPFYSGGVDADGTHHEGVASLVEGKERVTNSIVFTFRNGKLVRKPPPFKAMTVMKSQKRFAYEGAQAVADGKADSPHRQMILTLMSLSKGIREARKREGNISLPERDEWNVEKHNGEEVLVAKDRIEMMRVIEDFMVLANNEQGSRLLAAAEKYGDIPGVFRIHEAPTLAELRDAAVALGDTDAVALIDAREKDATASEQEGMPFETFLLLRFLDRMKLGSASRERIQQGVDDRIARGEVKPEHRAREIKRVIESYESERERSIMPVVMRLVTAAYFGTEPKGHFFIGSRWYTQWTSPMRRAVDNIVELLDRTRQYRDQGKNISLFSEAVRDALEPLLTHISERGKLAKSAEQQSLRMYATERLSKQIGQKIPLRVVRVRVKEGEYLGIVVRVPMKGTRYEQDYFLTPEDLEGFPDDIATLRNLRGDQQVTLLSTDVREGKIRIALNAQPRSTEPKRPPAPASRNPKRPRKS